MPFCKYPVPSARIPAFSGLNPIKEVTPFLKPRISCVLREGSVNNGPLYRVTSLKGGINFSGPLPITTNCAFLRSKFFMLLFRSATCRRLIIQPKWRINTRTTLLSIHNVDSFFWFPVSSDTFCRPNFCNVGASIFTNQSFRKKAHTTNPPRLFQ